MEEAIAQLDGVDTYQVTVGSGNSGLQTAFLGGGGGANTASFAITTELTADQDQVEQELRAAMSELQDVGDLTVTTGQACFGLPPIEVIVRAEDDQQMQEELDALDLPSGTDAEIGGVSAEQQSAFADLGMALLASIAIVYLVMVATFRSLPQPLILLVSIPFAATGALILLLATDTPLGVPAMIGLLMLVGIVVTNAIELIDLVNQKRDEGLPLREAIIEGARYRLRPILMTAAATIGALIPMSLGLTGGSVFISQPFALVVIGGLTTSTLLTLILVPVLYNLLGRATRTPGGAVDAAA